VSESRPQSTPQDPPEDSLDSFEGDYRPAGPAAASPGAIRVDQSQTEFLLRLTDALNTTLDLQTLLKRTAALVRAVIDYRIFAILLVDSASNDLRMRFQIGHRPDIERLRVHLGQGVTGQVALNHEPMLVPEVRDLENYIDANPEVHSELAVPLIVKNRVIGVIDIQSEQPDYFQPEHLRLLTLTASRIAQAIENARLYTRVSRQAQTLEVLNEISRELTSILDVERLFERIGQLVRRLFDYQMFSIWTVRPIEHVLENRFSLRFGERFHPNEVIPVERGIVGAAIAERRPVNIPDVRNDPRYHEINPETRSELAVPLIYKSKVLGVLDIEHTRANYFTQEHVRALTTLAAQIAIAIENAQLYQRVAQQEQRLDHDLQMAREVQLRLLPSTLPRMAHAEFAARFLPARTIGGDLYDYLRYDDQRGALAIGDVSGKGAAAALYGAVVSGAIRSFAGQKHSPAAMLHALNASLHERRLDSQYVTMLYSLWNDENLTLQVANAGSVQPILCRNGEIEPIPVEGFPLGMFPQAQYEEISLSLRPGDSVYFFSDGISDAENESEESFDERLIEAIDRHHHLPAEEAVEAIFTEVQEFQGDCERFDDETLIALRVV
jgi:phosphoserine phosphatase RsbU/P